jgi:pantoate--beta-alanine ligase
VRTLRTVAEVRAALHGARAEGRTIGLVPTMGALHDGHLSLIRHAREECDEVVVSLFVNPAQFDESADLAAYPRDEARDAELAAEAGADLMWAPPVDEVYPPGFATTVRVEGLTDVLEGAHRPGHFDGVATVVTKLFNVVRPDVAYFGQKDAQQLAVIRRLVRDLDMPVRVAALPTVREPDGLALSSRNIRLSEAERERAAALSRALTAAAGAAHAGAEPEEIRAAAHGQLRDAGIEPEYLALVDPETFIPIEDAHADVLVAVAARVGETRLIDNTLVKRNGRP